MRSQVLLGEVPLSGRGLSRMKTVDTNTIFVKKISSGKVADEYAVKANTKLTLVYVVSGSSDVELTPAVHLMGAYSEATVVGLITGLGNACINVDTLQHHHAPNTTSNLLIKSVLTDTSVCFYTGTILVDASAQKTDAYQRNENLLLDAETKATSSPALEILANDVRCTHGAVVKTLDEQEMWYLASRGIDRKTGRDMIASGFLESALALISDINDRSAVEQQIALRNHFPEI